MIDVNLLPDWNVLSRKEGRTKNILVLVVVTVTIFFGLGLLALAGGQKALALKQGNEVSTQQELERQLEQQKETVEAIRTIQQKLVGIRQARQNQADFAVIAQAVWEIVQPEVTLKKLTINPDGTVSFSGEVTDFQALGNFVTRISGDPKHRFTQVSLNGLRKDKDKLIFGVSALCKN